MKKTLCLLLIFTVLLSLFTFGGEAKDYSYEEMADFLNSLSILHGDASMGGDYNFYGSLTRAQFAKLAIASSTYKNSVPLKTNTSPFCDVTKDHWAAGYVKVANNNKLITGYPDSTFRPENGILLEEAVTVVLKLLGYQNSDFGSEWPNGQMSIAQNNELLNNVTVNQGEYMKRIDAIALLYNALTGDTKQGSAYLSTLGYTLSKNVTLISSYIQDTTLDTDEVVTSSGNYTVKGDFDYNKIGMRGDALIKNNKEIVGFFTDGQNKETYVITGVLGSTIIVNDKGTSRSFPIADETVAYYNSSKTTYSALSSRVSAGDSLSIISDDTGRVKYVTVESQRMEGPITVASSNFLSDLKMNENEVTVIKAGGTAGVNDIRVNDIIYYSKNLNTIWVYAEKRTGIYEDAVPNQNFPTSIVLSGITYEIESAEALSKLNSTGKCKLGEAITVLLGKDGKIADVATGSVVNDVVYGYSISSGMKNYTANGENYSSYYMTVVTPDGKETEFVTNKLYDGSLSRVVKLTFENSVAKVTVQDPGGPSGVFNYSGLMFGNNKLSRNINILDVKYNDNFETGEYVKVYPARLDGVSINSSNVLFCEKNSDNEIISLILKDATGDAYSYGIILKAEERGGTTYLLDGKESSVGSFFTVSKKTPARLDIKGGRLEGVQPLNQTGEIKDVTETYITETNGKKHYLSDKLSIYYVNRDNDYMLMTLSELLSNKDKYKISAYYDKSNNNGGRIRILVLR